jgi:pimeloyl-ACP methyl ester carboxylesterase
MLILFAVILMPLPLRAADEPTSHTFDVKGVKIHYLDAGKGEAVVLIHGLTSSAETNWKLPGILGELAKDHRVIAIDMPGHGKSDKPEKDEAYGTQIVEDVILLMDDLKIEKAHIVGYSLGGMVTMKLMVLHPDRVISGTLGGMGWLKEGSFLANFWDKMKPKGGTLGVPDAFMKNVGKLGVTEDEVKKITVPVEVLVGGKDPVKKMYVEPLENVRKDWHVVEIDDAGHFSCVTKKQFKDELVGWVKKNTK